MEHGTAFTAELDLIAEDLLSEVSDEALEAAGSNAMAQTITVFYLCSPPHLGPVVPELSSLRRLR